jgi:pimeloyl-ACP methyl ester carboxylesterase
MPGRLERIYAEDAAKLGPERAPVIVIPGILGSRLVDGRTGVVAWGAFTYGAADTDTPDGARLLALPMERGQPLSALRDEVGSDGVLERLDANVGPLKVTALEPYRGIIETLAAGRYVDRDLALGAAGLPPSRQAVDPPPGYAGGHFTCFQFDYDWRRDLSEQAERLDALVRGASRLAARARGMDEPVKVDIVAHSMGGLVAMYYLRYGATPLPEDGSAPPVTWAGAALVNRVVLVGSPLSGSVLAVKQLVDGVSYSIITPTYRPALLCTMPAVFELMPRTRHARVVDERGEPVDLYDPGTWERYGWGPADPTQAGVLEWLLPDERDPRARREIAMEHLGKCLARAEQFQRAVDAPAELPPGLEVHLVVGDAEGTPAVLRVDASSGRPGVAEIAPGDGTVARSSALMDERVGAAWSASVRSPVAWTSVRFIDADHIGLTASDAFTDNLLYLLLQAPRETGLGAHAGATVRTP